MNNMGKKSNIWVTKHPQGGWQSKREGSKKALGIFDTQAEAIEHSIKQAKIDRVEVITQGRDGKIRSKDSYGYDPPQRKDTEH